MPVLGKTTIECSLCGADGTPQWTGKHTFYVADIITGPILGADFLQKYRMDVQFSTGLLSFPNGNVPLVAREVGQERCSVILAHDVRFDNNTREVIALGRLSRPGESVILGPQRGSGENWGAGASGGRFRARVASATDVRPSAVELRKKRFSLDSQRSKPAPRTLMDSGRNGNSELPFNPPVSNGSRPPKFDPLKYSSKPASAFNMSPTSNDMHPAFFPTQPRAHEHGSNPPQGRGLNSKSHGRGPGPQVSSSMKRPASLPSKLCMETAQVKAVFPETDDSTAPSKSRGDGFDFDDFLAEMNKNDSVDESSNSPTENNKHSRFQRFFTSRGESPNQPKSAEAEPKARRFFNIDSIKGEDGILSILRSLSDRETGQAGGRVHNVPAGGAFDEIQTPTSRQTTAEVAAAFDRLVELVSGQSKNDGKDPDKENESNREQSGIAYLQRRRHTFTQTSSLSRVPEADDCVAAAQSSSDIRERHKPPVKHVEFCDQPKMVRCKSSPSLFRQSTDGSSDSEDVVPPGSVRRVFSSGASASRSTSHRPDELKNSGRHKTHTTPRSSVDLDTENGELSSLNRDDETYHFRKGIL